MVVSRRFSNTQFTSSSIPPSATPLSNTKPVSPSLFKSIFLHEWWLVKPQSQCQGLAVGGVTSLDGRERVFLSTVIAKRHEANVLETQDGITIVFRGFIHVSRTSQNGFPSENRADDVVPTSVDDNDLTTAKAPKQVSNELGDSLGNVSKQSQSIDNMECECKDNTSHLMAGKSTTKKMRKGRLSFDCKDAVNTCSSNSRMVTRSISRSHAVLQKPEVFTVASAGSPVRRSPRLYNSRKLSVPSKIDK